MPSLQKQFDFMRDDYLRLQDAVSQQSAIIAAQAEVIEALEWWQEVRQTLWLIRTAVTLPPVLRTKYARCATRYHYRVAESEAVLSLLHANEETARARTKLKGVQGGL